MRPDYYQLLDVSEKADAAEIKAAFRRMALRYHPDRNNDNAAAEERFKLVSEAYRELSDPERRYQYDGWLERQRRYVTAPELAAMPRHTRISARHGHDRRAARNERRRGAVRRRYTPRILNTGHKRSPLFYLCIYLVCLGIFIPWLFRFINTAPSTKQNTVPQHALPPGESPLPPDVQRANLERFSARISADAHKGDPAAQYRYGTMLYQGTGGMMQDREAGIRWWQKSAAQGFRAAEQALKSVGR